MRDLIVSDKNMVDERSICELIRFIRIFVGFTAKGATKQSGAVFN